MPGAPLVERAIFIVGAQKSGTSSLFDILARHSAVSRARMKEPDFLCLDRKVVAENWGWYQGLFADEEAVWLDGSTPYLRSHRAIDNVGALVRQPRVLIMLRDPAKRAYSGFLHMKRSTPVEDRRSFSDVMDDIESGGNVAIEEAEDVALTDCLWRGALRPRRLLFHSSFLRMRDGARFPSAFEDDLWNYRYFTNSCYSTPVERWVAALGDNVQLIFFDEFVSDTARQMQSVLASVDLPEEPHCLAPSHANRAQVPGRTARSLRNIWQQSRLVGRMRSWVSESRQARLKRWGLIRPEALRLGEADYRRARGLLHAEYDYWFSREPRLRGIWDYSQ